GGGVALGVEGVHRSGLGMAARSGEAAECAESSGVFDLAGERGRGHAGPDCGAFGMGARSGGGAVGGRGDALCRAAVPCLAQVAAGASAANGGTLEDADRPQARTFDTCLAMSVRRNRGAGSSTTWTRCSMM